MTNKTELLALIPDHKTTNRFVVRTDGQVYLVFGMTEDCVLVHLCYFADGGLCFRRLSQLSYSECSHITSREAIVADCDGNAVESKPAPSQEQNKMAKSILTIAKLPLGQRPIIYVSPTRDGRWVLATMSGDANKIVSTKILRTLKQTVMLWDPQSGTHRTIHTDDIG